MEATLVLRKFEIGNSVAEFDNDLELYFLETHTFRSVVEDRGDIIAGDKGTGKTAIYKILKKSYRKYPELSSVEIVDAFNVSGSPIFQKLSTGPNLTEGQYRTFWKAYIFSLLGNFLIDVYGATYNAEIAHLNNVLNHLDLTSPDTSPESVFEKLRGLVDRITSPKAIETGFSITEYGMPVITPRLEFENQADAPKEVLTDDFLRILDTAAATTDLKFWILFDRLDEAFPEAPDVEVKALRALFRSYLDLAMMDHVKLKLFVRRDLFRRIIGSGFVNLTHIEARKIEIKWDEDDLIHMIVKRLERNRDFFEICKLNGKNFEEVFSVILPHQIDIGDRKPDTKTWIMGRIRDGNEIRPPRNMIDLFLKAKTAQLSKDSKAPRDIDPSVGPILEAASMKIAVRELSVTRVQDTLLAEALSYAPFIEKFREGKSEHNVESLKATLRNPDNFSEIVKALVHLGFLESHGQNYKIPMLYRDGLKVTQGKAF